PGTESVHDPIEAAGAFLLQLSGHIIHLADDRTVCFFKISQDPALSRTDPAGNAKNFHITVLPFIPICRRSRIILPRTSSAPCACPRSAGQADPPHAPFYPSGSFSPLRLPLLRSRSGVHRGPGGSA